MNVCNSKKSKENRNLFHPFFFCTTTSRKMSESNDQPPAKRVKLEEELIPSTSSPSLPTTTTTEEIVPTSKSVLKYLTPIQFSFEGEKGLFGLVFPSLGFRASTEEETGILEYVDGTIPPFSGIIKHR